MPKNKKQESSSDDSSSEEVQKQQTKGKAAPAPAKKEEKKPAKKQESSDSSDSSDEKPKKGAKATTPAKKEEPKKAAKKESSDSSSEEKPAAKKAKTDAGAVTTTTAQTPAAGAAVEGNRLFLGNLSFKIDDDAIRAFFKDVGELTDIHWVTDKETGKFYGTGFIAFATAAEAKAAVAMAGQNVLDRPIKIDFAQSRGERTPNKSFEKKPFGDKKPFEQRAPTPKPDGCTTVFLGNLSFQIDENAVRTHFANCGEISNIRWVERDGQFKGCGFVEFAASEGTDKAVALNGSDLMGRAVRVDYSAPKPKKEW
jgi:nucleolin